MHRSIQIDPHHLGNATCIIAIAFVRLRLEERLRVPGFNANDREPSSGEALEQPLRQRASFKANPLNLPLRIFENLNQVIRMADDFHFPANPTRFINDAKGSLFHRDV
jgi:hypothetical protein